MKKVKIDKTNQKNQNKKIIKIKKKNIIKRNFFIPKPFHHHPKH